MKYHNAKLLFINFLNAQIMPHGKNQFDHVYQY
jgi:hypothetical protein